MNDREKATAVEPKRRLSDAIREVRTAAAERDDVVVEMREAARMRLELLAQELEPVFAEVPAEEIQFDFVISSGLQPRLWIDAVSHVAMGRDRRTYRFVRDTRLGRTVVAESNEIKPIADHVTRYIAERMIERQRWLDGTIEPLAEPAKRRDAAADRAANETAPAADGSVETLPAPKPEAASVADAAVSAGTPGESPAQASAEPTAPSVLRTFASGIGVVLVGAAAGLAVLAAIYWDRVVAYVSTM